MVQTEDICPCRWNTNPTASLSVGSFDPGLYASLSLIHATLYLLDQASSSPSKSATTALGQPEAILGDSPTSKSRTDSNTITGLPDDTFGSLITGATGAASALGSWFTSKAKAAQDKAPELFEKTSKMSQDVFTKTKTAATGAFEKTAVFAKQASMAVEQFVEQKLEQHGVVAAKEGDQEPPRQPVPDEKSPLAE